MGIFNWLCGSKKVEKVGKIKGVTIVHLFLIRNGLGYLLRYLMMREKKLFIFDKIVFDNVSGGLEISFICDGPYSRLPTIKFLMTNKSKKDLRIENGSTDCFIGFKSNEDILNFVELFIEEFKIEIEEYQLTRERENEIYKKLEDLQKKLE